MLSRTGTAPAAPFVSSGCFCKPLTVIERSAPRFGHGFDLAGPVPAPYGLSPVLEAVRAAWRELDRLAVLPEGW